MHDIIVWVMTSYLCILSSQHNNMQKHWFKVREEEFGLVPVSSSYTKAEQLLKKYNDLVLTAVGNSGSDLKKDLWKLIKEFPYKSRPLAALVSLMWC